MAASVRGNVRWRVPRARWAVVVASGFFLIAALCARTVLQAFPNSGDEYAYLYQARLFSEGRLWDAPLEPREFLANNRVWQKGDKRLSQYPPGWPALLAAAGKAGLPFWLVNPILGAGLIVATYALARREAGEDAARLATMALALSPFTVFSAASYFSHVLTALLLVAFWLACSHRAAGGGPAWALGAGVALSLAFATRPFTTALCGAPALLSLLARRGRHAPGDAAMMALAALPAVAVVMGYNHATTGDSFTFTAAWLDAGERIGFRSVQEAVKSVLYSARYGGELMLWGPPAALALLAAAPRIRPAAGGDYLAWAFPCLALGYLFYARDAGNRYGPRYWFEAYPALLIWAARRGGPLERKALGVGVLACLPALAALSWRERAVVTERRDAYRQVEEMGLSNAVLFFGTGTGARRPMAPGDLTRNDSRVATAPLVYAKDLGPRNRELLAAFPGRRAYLYYRTSESPRGRIQELRFPDK